jgi:formimidoylglutamate deiminase
MYRMLNRLDADAFEAVASLAFMEMLKTGFTTVGEFHYLHHQENGDPYDDRAELVGRILAAQEQSGIGLCLLPVLYRTGGIGRPVDDGQRRFVSRSLAEYFELMDLAGARLENIPLANLGAAPHSLRAVPADELPELVEWNRSVAPHSPIHMHISEQLREVDEILEAYGQRPIAWLAEHIGIDRSWTLIHATHADESELQAISDAGATVSLCPVTEGNLGDGIFPFPDLSHQRIAWGIGTDSNVRIDAVEEIRQLEYSQRLRQHRRSILTDADDPRVGSPGRTAVEAISYIAEQSLGHRSGRFKPGYRADLVVLDDSHTALEDHGLDSVLDALLVSGDRSCISDVMVAGRWVVRDRHHFEEEAIISKWRAVRSHVLG